MEAPHPTNRLDRPASMRGTGLHTGAECELQFVPAPPGTGLVFLRADLPGEPRIPASLECVTSTDRRTVLTAGSATVSTVEHVLAAVAAMGIAHLIMRISGPEPPQMDGSAAPFIEAIIQAGTTGIEDDQPAFVVDRPVEVREGAAHYRLVRAGTPRVSVSIDFPHPLIGKQELSIVPTMLNIVGELAGARTFGFASELDVLRHRDLIRGAREGAGILFTDDGVMGGPLRWPNECVRHKTLDLIGDLALLGAPVGGHIFAREPSHRGNVAFARAVASSCRLETTRAGHP